MQDYRRLRHPYAGIARMPNKISPFANMEENTLRGLAPRGVMRSFAKNAVLVNQGDRTDSLYVLLSGRVKAYVSDESGKEVVVNTIEAGDYFGEMVLDGGPRSASVMSLEPCRCFVIPRDEVEALLTSHPEFARHLIDKLIGTGRRLTAKVFELALKDVYSRFSRFVNESAVEDGGVRVVRERLTQTDIAARIGGSREMVSRILRDLSAGGYISIEAKQIRILRKLPAHW